MCFSLGEGPGGLYLGVRGGGKGGFLGGSTPDGTYWNNMTGPRLGTRCSADGELRIFKTNGRFLAKDASQSGGLCSIQTTYIQPYIYIYISYIYILLLKCLYEDMQSCEQLHK